MGYTTEFQGTITFSRELKASEILAIQAILAVEESDKLARQINYEHMPHIPRADRNYSYIQLILNKTFDGLQWDGGEKCYYMLTTLNVVMQAIMIEIPDLRFGGGMMAQGEETGDVWGIEIKNEGTVAYQKAVMMPEQIRCPHCHDWFKASEAETRGGEGTVGGR